MHNGSLIKYLKKFNLYFGKRKKNLKKKWKCLILLFFIAICLSVFFAFKNIYYTNEPTSIEVSVIIPCYDSEIYLPNLFSMFKAQTLKNYELIFIDDGSNDNTNSLIRNQKGKDKRIKLITLEQNTGAGNARNVGLKSAIGEYIIFLDSDDIFYPNLLKTSYEIASKYDIDILVFDFECIHNNISCQYYRNWLFKYPFPINEVFSQEDISDYIFIFSRGVPWNKLFKRDFIIRNNLRFLNLKKHNDSFFIYTAYVMAKRIYMITEVLLRYRWGNKKSITSTYKNFAKESVQKNLKELKNFLLDKKLYNIYKNSFQEISIHF